MTRRYTVRDFFFPLRSPVFQPWPTIYRWIRVIHFTPRIFFGEGMRALPPRFFSIGGFFRLPPSFSLAHGPSLASFRLTILRLSHVSLSRPPERPVISPVNFSSFFFFTFFFSPHSRAEFHPATGHASPPADSVRRPGREVSLPGYKIKLAMFELRVRDGIFRLWIKARTDYQTSAQPVDYLTRASERASAGFPHSTNKPVSRESRERSERQ